jgi:hypothetical protein
MTGYALNAAIGLQVLLGSLTTGLSVVVTAGHQVCLFQILYAAYLTTGNYYKTSVMTAILGEGLTSLIF